MKRKALVYILFLICGNLFSQDNSGQKERFCDTEVNQRYIQNHPEKKQAIEFLNQKLESQFNDELSVRKKKQLIQHFVIPVVFHILHQNGNENISDAQVHDAMQVLNADFQKLNFDTIDVVDSFKNRIGKSNIEFRLARKDPSGNTTTGINRLVSNLTFNADESAKFVQWDRSKYLNVWVVDNIASGAAGYTYKPGVADGFSSGDGIILLHNYLGRIGTGSYRNSRTLTHEVGHWINLDHPWGWSNEPGKSTNCNMDDGVADTPLTIGWTSCNLNGKSCGSLDNVQNYMEYSYCDRMFTKQQITKMEVALKSNTARRSNLWSKKNLNETGVTGLDEVAFSSKNRTVCIGTEIYLNDNSKYDPINWSWKVSNGKLKDSKVKSPEVSFSQSGIQSVSLTVGDSNNTLSKTSNNFIYVTPKIGKKLPYEESFEKGKLEDLGYMNFEFTDSTAFEWKVTDIASYSGSKSLFLEASQFTQYETRSVMLFAKDLSPYSSAKLKFKISGVQSDLNDISNTLIFVSYDCGTTWESKGTELVANYSKGSPTALPYIPSGLNDWDTFESRNLLSEDRYSNRSVLIRIEHRSKGGNNVFMDDITIDYEISNIPALLEPLSNSDNVAIDTSLVWKTIENIDKYQYMLDVDTSFKTNKFETAFVDTLSSIDSLIRLPISNLDSGTTYYWKVRTFIGGTPSPWSEIWSFSTVRKPTIIPSTFILGLENIHDINLYPNPFTNEITVESVNGTIDISSIEIINVLGEIKLKELISSVNKSYTFNTDILENGIYFINISSSNGFFVRKIIKN